VFQEGTAKTMNWDYSFFVPRNNLFSKQWETTEQDIKRVAVDETNRDTYCTACGKHVGEVSDTYYAYGENCYCSECHLKPIIDTAE
jgi:hypothetical protein